MPIHAPDVPTQALDLGSTFVVIEPGHAAVPVAVTPSIFDQLDARFGGFAGHLLVSSFGFETDWPTWEMHPAGDEIVCLLSGKATLVLDRDGVEEAVSLRDPGAFVVVPKGTWHTARIAVPTRMLFLTPGAGTCHKPV